MAKEMYAPVLLLNVSYTRHSNQGYGWVRNVSTSFNQCPNFTQSNRASQTSYLHFCPLIDWGSLLGCWSPHLVQYVQQRLALQPLLQQHPLALREEEEKRKRELSFSGSHFSKNKTTGFSLRAPLTATLSLMKHINSTSAAYSRKWPGTGLGDAAASASDETWADKERKPLLAWSPVFSQ